jgi:hypothetical protein
MRRRTFEISVSQSTAPLDMRLLTRLLAASAVRQHLARAQRARGDEEEMDSVS